MWLGGYRGTQQMDRIGTLKRNLLSVAVLCALAIFLSEQLQNLVSKQIYEAYVRTFLNVAAKGHGGACIMDVRFQEQVNRTVVVAVYSTPSPFTPQEVGLLEQKLPASPGAGTVELLVRSVPISVASKSGYLFSDEDLHH